MRARRKLILTVVASAVIATIALPAARAGASGGGGCGRPVTESRGTTMRIRNYCFGPTILRARPGQQITFVNRDPVTHTVLGANATWGSYRELRRGDDVTYEFQRAGVYPFVCTYHPGMIGAVVIGGAGAPMSTTGDGRSVVPVREADVVTAAAVNDVPSPSTSRGESDGGPQPWVVAVAVMGSMILAAGVALRGRGREVALSSRGEGSTS